MDGNGLNPLHLAVEEYYVVVVDHLLNVLAELDAVDKDEQYCASLCS